MLLNLDNPISQRSSVMQNCLKANCPGFIETLQIWTPFEQLWYTFYSANFNPKL